MRRRVQVGDIRLWRPGSRRVGRRCRAHGDRRSRGQRPGQIVLAHQRLVLMRTLLTVRRRQYLRSHASEQRQDPGALRGIARRPSSFDGRRVPHVWIRPMRTGRLVADRRRPRRGSTTVRTRNLRFCRLPARSAQGHVRPRPARSRFQDAHPHISHRRRRAPGRTRPLEQTGLPGFRPSSRSRRQHLATGPAATRLLNATMPGVSRW